MHSRPPLCIALALFSACFSSPPTGSIPVRCGEGDPCPDGWVCRDSLCALSGIASQDMSAPADLSIPAVGCASGGGSKLSERVYACPGAFGLGEARPLCSIGWQVCKDASLVPLSDCQLLAGFYVADVPAHLNPAFTCGATTIFDRALMGCGSCTGICYDSGVYQCGGFRVFIRNKQGSFNMDAGHSIDKTINNDSRYGILCCKP